LSRLTSETNPESGTTTYLYGGPSGFTDNCYPGGFADTGDLHQITYATGNYVCYIYDKLHRLTDAGNNVDTTSPCQRFRYDNASNGYTTAPSGFPTSPNAGGRLIEAATDNCGGTGDPIVTDEWFAYDADGRLTDTWESTPNSGGYYHSSVAPLAANGALTSISTLGSSSAQTYTLDGEGRLNTVKNSSSVGVSSVSYDASSMPTTITTTSGDTDIFMYDPNTERMTNYTYTVNGKAMAGALKWNANGTLQKLAITDGFYSAGTQTCYYNPSLSSNTGYDNLGRLVGVNCGSSVWSQSFSYDPFGNITKSGSLAWAPGYNSSTNQYQNGSTYDANGNLKYDTFNSYTWSVYNKPATIIAGNMTPTCGTSGTCLTYDAFGRVVEENASGTITQIFYEPASKSIMSGQNVKERRFPLPGGATADNVTGWVTLFWHQDWLGSSRLVSSIGGRAIEYDRAFAPYGEIYDKALAGNQYELFTGDTQDNFAGLFDTPNREYHPNQGRWISPDPAGLKSADPLNPQSWNLYAYVRNNPLSATDPNGLWCVWDDGSGHDDDSTQGGDTQDQCNAAGGHWDATDTITNLWENNGVITFMSVIGWGPLNVSGAGMTTDQLDIVLAANNGTSKAPYLFVTSDNCSATGRDINYQLNGAKGYVWEILTYSNGSVANNNDSATLNGYPDFISIWGTQSPISQRFVMSPSFPKSGDQGTPLQIQQSIGGWPVMLNSQVIQRTNDNIYVASKPCPK
jgi:RHS repeat-associated protein